MDKTLKQILDWSEVWALLIPLVFMLAYKARSVYLKPIRIFIWVALFLHLFIDIIANMKDKLGIEEGDFLWNNNFLYNISSLIRFFLFSWFFILLGQQFMRRVKVILQYIFIVFVLVNFIFFEKFIPQGDYESFSSRLLATESALLLFYCLQYFIALILDEKHTKLHLQPGFWVVTGLTIYVGASFFIYLFYNYLTDAKRNFAVNIWDVHNIVFIVLCIFMAGQFYQDHKIAKR